MSSPGSSCKRICFNVLAVLTLVVMVLGTSGLAGSIVDTAAATELEETAPIVDTAQEVQEPDIVEEPVQVEPSPEPSLTPSPTPSPTPEPTATMVPTVEPTAPQESTIEPTAPQESTVEPTATLESTIVPTATLESTIEPTATTVPTIAPTATVAPTATPSPSATPTPAMTTRSMQPMTVVSGSGWEGCRQSSEVLMPGSTISVTCDVKVEVWHLESYTFAVSFPTMEDGITLSITAAGINGATGGQTWSGLTTGGHVETTMSG